MYHVYLRVVKSQMKQNSDNNRHIKRVKEVRTFHVCMKFVAFGISYYFFNMLLKATQEGDKIYDFCTLLSVI